MSLLSEIFEHLETNPEIVVSEPRRDSTLGSFATLEISVVPTSTKTGQELSQLLQELLPMEPYRVYDFFDLAQPFSWWGELCFKEEIGSETIARTFTVDDAGLGIGREFSAGVQDPITHPLERRIFVKHYPRTKHNLRFRFGLAA